MLVSLTIRPLRKSEIVLLDEFLYDAIFIPPDCEKPPPDIIYHPEIYVYIKDFGKKDDLCLVAENNGEVSGAVWTRYFSEAERGFGFVNSETPELSMSVKEQYRGQGIGTRLLESMIKMLHKTGARQVSLSVDKINYAYRLYKKYGFEDYESCNDSIIMLLKLK